MEPEKQYGVNYSGPPVYSYVRSRTIQDLRYIIAQQIPRLTEEFTFIQQNVNNVFGNQKDTLRANEMIAVAMRRAVVRSYDQKVGPRHLQYRNGEWRFSGGNLRRVLNTFSYFKITPRQLIFLGDVQRLDREAAHWARLNFGAGSISGGPEPVNVTVDRKPLYSFTLGGPRPAFRLPRGYFSGSVATKITTANGDTRYFIGYRAHSPERRGQDPFYPLSNRGGPGPLNLQQTGLLAYMNANNRARYTRGIKGRHFLEAGIRKFGDAWSAEYQALFEKWSNQVGTTYKR